MKTYHVRKEDVVRSWWVVDAQGKVLGRLASQIARVLMGKHKPYYQPDVDCGDFVIVLNADKLVVTGKRLEQKNTTSTATTLAVSRREASLGCWKTSPKK